MSNLTIRLGVLIGLILASLSAGAAVVTCTSVAKTQTDWNKANAWDAACGGQPPVGATVIIASGTNILADANTLNVADITINAGGILAIKKNNTVSLSGNFTNNGTFTAPAGSTVSFTGANQTISGNVTFANLQVGLSTVLTLASNIVVTGNITGTLNLFSTCPMDYTLTSNGGATVAHSCAWPRPIAEFRFDETASGAVADSSGNNLNGSLNGGVMVGGSGKVCGSYNFNGTDAFVSVPDSAKLNPTTASVAAWVRHTSSTSKTWETILAKGDTAYRLHLNGGCSINTPNVLNGLSYGLNSGCSTADADSGVVPVTNQWHHVVGTYDGTTIKIYVDGVQKVSNAYAPSIGSNTYALLIGENPQMPGRFWSGDIDEVKIYSGALPATQVTSIYTNENAGKNWDGTARTCPVLTVDHILIQHPGVGLTCSPQTVLVTACANAACTGFVGGIGVTLQPGGATVTTSATGAVSGTVAQTTAGAVALSATSATATANPTQCINTTSGTASCSMTFDTAGFVITAPNHTACNAATVTIEAMQATTTNRCVPAYSNVTRSVDLSLAYTNPTTGTKLATVATGTIGTTATAHSLAFDANGKATLSLTYPDVGLVTLNATGIAPNGVSLSGSGSFVAAPASLSLSATTPAAPIKAGNAFDVTVQGYTAVSSACPTALATPNFGHETVPQLALVKTRTGPASGGNDPALSTSIITTLASGVSANQSWPEVGDITLQARLLPDAVTPAVSNYLGYVLGAEVHSVVSGNIRFIPDHFDTTVVSAGGVPMGCPHNVTGFTCPATYNGMVYSGQPFSVKVTAKNLADVVTVNYAGTYAKDVTLSAWGALGGTTPPGGATANGTWAGSIAATSFSVGEASTASASYTFTTAPTNPTDIYVRAEDTDSVSSLRASNPPTSVEGGVKVASGRIKVANAYGSELLPLTLTATAQYYASAASGWVRSITDTVTSLSLAANYKLLDKTGAETGTTAASKSPATGLLAGVLTITLAKPSAGAAGVATVTPVAPAYLPVTSGTATFGVYKGARDFIYMREMY